MLKRLHGYLVLTYTGLSVVVLFAVILIPMIVTRSGDVSIWFAREIWSRSICWLAGVKVKVLDAGRIPKGPAVFAANHESAFDINVLFLALKRNSLRFVAKKELFDIPVFGWYLNLAGYIKVDRRNRKQAFDSLKLAGAKVRAGTSLIVFPEGTRSKDGRVHPFKKGPFVLAREANVPVVPVAIVGAHEITPKGVIAVAPGTVTVAIGEPVDPALYPDKSSLLYEVRRRIIELHRAHGGRGGDVEDAIAGAGLEGRSRPEPAGDGRGPRREADGEGLEA